MAERLLLVDADRDFCALMRDYLAGECFEVSCVHDGIGALARLLAQAFDIVVAAHGARPPRGARGRAGP